MRGLNELFISSLFSVQETIYHDQQSPTPTGKVPLSMTLLTNNVSLFCDDDMHGAHKAAIRSFWSRIRQFFHNNSVRSIELVIVHTGTVTQHKEPLVTETLHRTGSMDVESRAPKGTGGDSMMVTDTHHKTDDIPMDVDTMKETATIIDSVSTGFLTDGSLLFSPTPKTVKLISLQDLLDFLAPWRLK